ncbi:hypothetical protein GC177_07935 [bacterium]|nr:hypothetical protein [bacterium]
MTSDFPPLLAAALGELAGQSGFGALTPEYEMEGESLVVTASGKQRFTLPFPVVLAELKTVWQSLNQNENALILPGNAELIGNPPYVKQAGKAAKLTESEFAILSMLAQNADGVSRQLILKKALHSKLDESETDLLESHLYRLRKKLRPLGLTLESHKGSIICGLL